MTDSEPSGVDHAWVMQTTFVVTILAGVPVVVALSFLLELPDWSARAGFVVRVGALVWFVTAVATYVYARRNDVGGTGDEEHDARRLGGGEDGDSAPPGED